MRFEVGNTAVVRCVVDGRELDVNISRSEMIPEFLCAMKRVGNVTEAIYELNRAPCGATEDVHWVRLTVNKDINGDGSEYIEMFPRPIFLTPRDSISDKAVPFQSRIREYCKWDTMADRDSKLIVFREVVVMECILLYIYTVSNGSGAQER